MPAPAPFRTLALCATLFMLASCPASAQEGEPPATPNPVVTTNPTAPIAKDSVTPIRQSQLRGRVEGEVLPGTRLTPPRLGRHAGFTRLVLDLPSGAGFTITPQGRVLRIDIDGASAAPLEQTSLSEEIISLKLLPSPQGASLTLQTVGVSALGGWRGMLLPAEGTRGARLVLDVSPALANHTPLPEFSAIAPLPASSLAYAQQELVAPNVLLDPGHGGRFPGAVGSVIEKDVALRVALKTREFLTQAGINVRMTRETDRHLSEDLNTDLRVRPSLADAGTKLFVSIHANSIDKDKALRGYGIETWWNPNHPDSENLARTLQQQLVNHTATYSRGVRHQASFAVLRGARVPAALVEMGFVSHPIDGQNLLNDAYLDRVAFAIAQGIRDTLAQEGPKVALR